MRDVDAAALLNFRAIVAGVPAQPGSGVGRSAIGIGGAGIADVTGAAARGTKRPDVAKVYGNEEYIAAGFDGAVNVEKAPLGRYSMWIIQKSGATQLSCNSKKFVELQ